MFDTLYSQIGAVLIVCVCGFAFLVGDEAEKIGAGSYILAWFCTIVLQSDIGFYSNAPVLFFVDVVVLIVFCALSWKSANTWPAWAAALQLLPVLSHFLMAIDMRPPGLVVLRHPEPGQPRYPCGHYRRHLLGLAGTARRQLQIGGNSCTLRRDSRGAPCRSATTRSGPPSTPSPGARA